MLKTALIEAEKGKIDEAFIIAHDKDDAMISFTMGQTESELVFDIERAKLTFLTGTYTFTDYKDEED